MHRNNMTKLYIVFSDHSVYGVESAQRGDSIGHSERGLGSQDFGSRAGKRSAALKIQEPRRILRCKNRDHLSELKIQSSVLLAYL